MKVSTLLLKVPIVTVPMGFDLLQLVLHVLYVEIRFPMLPKAVA
jgi:hypothetical protein